MRYYKRKIQRYDLTRDLTNIRPKMSLHLIAVVALFGSCLILIQSNLGVNELRTPVPSSSRRNLEAVDFSNVRSLVKILEDKPPGENCEWVEPKMLNQSDSNDDFFSTIIVSYPGSAKRAAFLQLEGLTELLTTDDYDLKIGKRDPDPRYAFIKTQYPHHEGIWSWGARGNQTVYVLQNPRMALQTYMFLLHEIQYSNGWLTSHLNIPNTFTTRPSVDEWETFKRDRFIREVNSWSWHLEYWMDNGLLRDIFTHDLTSPEYMDGIMNPSIYTQAELESFQRGLSVVNATFDKHCVEDAEGVEGDMPYCMPVAIVSYEKLMQESTGPTEVGKLAAVIQNQASMNVAGESLWECVWRKVVIEKDTGVRVDSDRDGPESPTMDSYSFTTEEVETIIGELERLKEKYSTSQLTMAASVNEVLVDYLTEYIAEQYTYLLSL